VPQAWLRNEAFGSGKFYSGIDVSSIALGMPWLGVYIYARIGADQLLNTTIRKSEWFPD